MSLDPSAIYLKYPFNAGISILDSDSPNSQKFAVDAEKVPEIFRPNFNRMASIVFKDQDFSFSEEKLEELKLFNLKRANFIDGESIIWVNISYSKFFDISLEIDGNRTQLHLLERSIDGNHKSQAFKYLDYFLIKAYLRLHSEKLSRKIELTAVNSHPRVKYVLTTETAIRARDFLDVVRPREEYKSGDTIGVKTKNML